MALLPVLGAIWVVGATTGSVLVLATTWRVIIGANGLALLTDADLKVAVEPDGSVLDELEDWCSETAESLVAVDGDIKSLVGGVFSPAASVNQLEARVRVGLLGGSGPAALHADVDVIGEIAEELDANVQVISSSQLGVGLVGFLVELSFEE